MYTLAQDSPWWPGPHGPSPVYKRSESIVKHVTFWLKSNLFVLDLLDEGADSAPIGHGRTCMQKIQKHCKTCTFGLKLDLRPVPQQQGLATRPCWPPGCTLLKQNKRKCTCKRHRKLCYLFAQLRWLASASFGTVRSSKPSPTRSSSWCIAFTCQAKIAHTLQQQYIGAANKHAIKIPEAFMTHSFSRLSPSTLWRKRTKALLMVG